MGAQKLLVLREPGVYAASFSLEGLCEVEQALLLTERIAWDLYQAVQRSLVEPYNLDTFVLDKY